ncbi:MAG: DUF2169 domain-containing protein [Polyangiales bacterium]
MLQLANETPFTAGMLLFADARGVETLYVVVKSTFDARDGAVTVADAQEPLCLADEYWGDPESSSLRRASEARIARPGTDVLVAGHVHAPGGRAAATVDASVRVGPLRATIRAIGDRLFTGDATPPYCTAPRPFTTMPLRYERAFGGAYVDPGDRTLRVDRRNPVGRGFVPEGTRDLRPLRGASLPNLEDPSALWQRPGDLPPPCATGPIAPSWLPRAGYAGTYDEHWQTRRAPYLPDDFDQRFFHVAHPSLVSAAGLRGGESVELERLTPDGAWRFALPAITYAGEARVGRDLRALTFSLEAVHLDADEARVTLVHRAAVTVDKRALQVSSVRVGLSGGAP